jgi:hypothetical protein
MYMVKHTSTLMLVLLAGVLASGCAQPPAARVDTAKQQLEAIAADGQAYAPQQYKAAQDAAAQLDAELTAQRGRLAPFRSYTKAAELVQGLESATGDTRSAIDGAKARLRTETTALVTGAKNAAADARKAMADIPHRGVPETEVKSWESDLNGVDASLSKVATELGSDQLADAHTAAQAASKTATEVKNQVDELQARLRKARHAAAQDEVTIPRVVLADGKRLPPGTYRLRLGAADQAPAATERWVQFLRNGRVAGRGLAVVIPDTSIGEVAKSSPPKNAVRVDSLKGGNYVRVWLNRGGTNYLVHLPAAQG